MLTPDSVVLPAPLRDRFVTLVRPEVAGLFMAVQAETSTLRINPVENLNDVASRNRQSALSELQFEVKILEALTDKIPLSLAGIGQRPVLVFYDIETDHRATGECLG